MWQSSKGIQPTAQLAALDALAELILKEGLK
jgi:hypothetical protein